MNHQALFRLIAWVVAMGATWPILTIARPWLDSSARIVVFADQLPEGMSEAQRQFAASHLAGTQKMRVSEIRALRAYNANFLCLHYQLGLGCGTHAFIIGDEWTSDWTHVNSNESWFLHNASAQRVHQTTWDWDVMDITSTGGVFHSGFPEYWMTTCLERITLNEDDGVFADSFTVDGYFDQCNPSHAWFQDVDLCLANWIPSLNAYGAAIKNRLEADGRGFRFLPNLGGLITSWDTTDYSMGHGGMIECFCFWEGGNYFDLADWRLQMERAIALVRNDAIIICQSYIGENANVADRLFALASYLLIKGRFTYLYLLADEGLEYYPEYTLNLGTAAGGMPTLLADLWNETWQVYQREYTNGLVLVNPGDQPVTVALPGTNYLRVAVSGGGTVNENGDYNGSVSVTAVTSVTLAAYSGVILLKSSSGLTQTTSGDFDGDGLADPYTVDSAGNWYFWFSASHYQYSGAIPLGQADWTPIVGDFDGDGLADPTMVDSAGNWYFCFSSGSYLRNGPYALGQVGWTPVAGDFDGDDLADPTMVDSADNWYFCFSSGSYQRNGPYALGQAGWTPVAGDFDGDSLADPTMVDAHGKWYFWFSGSHYQRSGAILLGQAGWRPVAGDFDGDSLADPTMVDSAVNWYFWFSSGSYLRCGPFALPWP